MGWTNGPYKVPIICQLSLQNCSTENFLLSDLNITIILIIFKTVNDPFNIYDINGKGNMFLAIPGGKNIESSKNRKDISDTSTRSSLSHKEALITVLEYMRSTSDLLDIMSIFRKASA